MCRFSFWSEKIKSSPHNNKSTTNTEKEEKGREIFFSARRKAFFYSRFAFSRAHPSRPDLTIYSLKTEEEEEEEEE